MSWLCHWFVASMTIRLLRSTPFLRATGSIAQAARLKHSLQPAISHQLGALERETGTELQGRQV